MKENQIGQMIKEFGDGLPHFQPKTRKRRVAPIVLSLSGAAAVVVSVILLSPSAEARSYSRMISALEGAKTMEAEMYRRTPDGKYVLETREWLNGTKWAFERNIPRPTFHRIFVTTQTDYDINYMTYGITTREPRTEDFTQGKGTILDWVIDRNDEGVVGAPRTLHRLDSAPIDGHSAYVLRFEKHTTGSGASQTIETLWIDSKTNLPIRCAVSVKDAGHRDHDIVTYYHFNVPVPDSVFVPRFQPVIDLVDVKTKLTSAWQEHPAARGKNSDVLDAQVAKDGSLYLLFTGDWTPTKVTGANGESYVRVLGYEPGGMQENSQLDNIKVDGRLVWGAAYVPVKPVSVASTSFNVHMQHSSGDWNFVKVLPGPAEALVVPARPCTVWPDYTFTMVLPNFLVSVERLRLENQARSLEKEGDIDGALVLYKQAAQSMKAHHSEATYRELIPAEAMLRRAGRTREADQLKVEIEAGKALDPSAPVPVTHTP